MITPFSCMKIYGSRGLNTWPEHDLLSFSFTIKSYGVYLRSVSRCVSRSVSLRTYVRRTELLLYDRVVVD